MVNAPAHQFFVVVLLDMRYRRYTPPSFLPSPFHLTLSAIKSLAYYKSARLQDYTVSVSHLFLQKM